MKQTFLLLLGLFFVSGCGENRELEPLLRVTGLPSSDDPRVCILARIPGDLPDGVATKVPAGGWDGKHWIYSNFPTRGIYYHPGTKIIFVVVDDKGDGAELVQIPAVAAESIRWTTSSP